MKKYKDNDNKYEEIWRYQGSWKRAVEKKETEKRGNEAKLQGKANTLERRNIKGRGRNEAYGVLKKLTLHFYEKQKSQRYNQVFISPVCLFIYF